MVSIVKESKAKLIHTLTVIYFRKIIITINVLLQVIRGGSVTTIDCRMGNYSVSAK